MKTLLLLGVVLMASLTAGAVEPDRDFNPALQEIYDSLTSPGDSGELLGKEFTVELILKYASNDHLVFRDAFLRVDPDTKYQIARWEFSTEVVERITGRSGTKFRVKFVIREVKKTGVYEEMPHVIARVMEAG